MLGMMLYALFGAFLVLAADNVDRLEFGLEVLKLGGQRSDFVREVFVGREFVGGKRPGISFTVDGLVGEVARLFEERLQSSLERVDAADEVLFHNRANL